MILGGEIQDPWTNKVREQVRSPKLNFPGFAPFLVVSVHLGKPLLELQRDPLAHDANAVDCVDKGLRIGVEEVSYSNGDHIAPLQRKNKC